MSASLRYHHQRRSHVRKEFTSQLYDQLYKDAHQRRDPNRSHRLKGSSLIASSTMPCLAQRHLSSSIYIAGSISILLHSSHETGLAVPTPRGQGAKHVPHRTERIEASSSIYRRSYPKQPKLWADMLFHIYSKKDWS